MQSSSQRIKELSRFVFRAKSGALQQFISNGVFAFAADHNKSDVLSILSAP